MGGDGSGMTGAVEGKILANIATVEKYTEHEEK